MPRYLTMTFLALIIALTGPIPANAEKFEVRIPTDFNSIIQADRICDKSQTEHLLNRTNRFITCMSKKLRIPVQIYANADRKFQQTSIAQHVFCKKQVGIETTVPDHMIPITPANQWVPRRLVKKFNDCLSQNKILVWYDTPARRPMPRQRQHQMTMDDVILFRDIQARGRQMQEPLPNLLMEMEQIKARRKSKCRHIEIYPGTWETTCQ